MEVIEDEQEGIKYFKDVVLMEIPIPVKKDGSVLREDGRVVYENKKLPVCSISVVAFENSNELPYHKHKLTHSSYYSVDGEGILIGDERRAAPFSTYVHIRAKRAHAIRGDITFICVEIPPDDNDFIPVD